MWRCRLSWSRAAPRSWRGSSRSSSGTR
jgi:hypothetical protein